MRWRRTRSRDVIDVRGRSGGGLGGGLPIPMGVGGIGGGAGLIIVLVILGIQLFGGGGGFDVGDAFDDGIPVAGEGGRGEGLPASQDPQRELRDFSAYVFTDAQDTWSMTFEDQGEPYDRAQLVLYTDRVNTACGSASSAIGPFYCPGDERVYLDLSFYRDMAQELRAGGDFAWAYVIAHEMGHHVQRLTGTNAEVERLSRADPGQANALSVRLELQADCYAGVWANTIYEQGDLEPGDLSEAFTASEAVGDDRLQRQATGRIDPDSFTHGTSEQRRRWFEAGYRSGDPAACDTFSPDSV